MDKKDSFVFYRSFYESLVKIPDKEQRLLLFEAIAEYALNQKKVDLHGYSEVLFPLIKPQLDANQKRYESGKKGGAPKGNRNAKKQPKNNQKQPNVNVNVNDNVNVDVVEATTNNLFMAFWDNYGRKGYIEDTYKYWLSLGVDEELNNAIVEGAKNYTKATETMRMKYPRTFLKNRMWIDYQNASKVNNETPRMDEDEQLLYFYNMGLGRDQLLAKGATVDKLDALGIK